MPKGWTNRVMILFALGVAVLAPAAPAPAPAATAAPPQYTVTRYVSNPDPARFRDLGCAAGQAATAAGPADGIVILDFGQPRVWDDGATFGTYDFGNHLDSIGAISAVARAWLQGYWDCTPDGGPYVRLAVGTSNYRGATTYDHGRAWADMVNALNDWVVESGYGSRMAVRGANDMELSWNSAATTRAWIEGYHATGRYNLYDYGDDEGGLEPPDGWTAEDVWYKAYGAPLNAPVPEIYYEVDATLDWQPLSLWAYQNKGRAIEFIGTLTQHSDDPETLTPEEGWRALFDTLGTDPRTAQPELRFASDITWNNGTALPPPSGAAEPAKTWGLLAADVGPIPVPGRVFVAANKWLGDVDGTFTALYAGSARRNPEQGMLVIYQPESGKPPRLLRAPSPDGALRILAVDGATVSLAAAESGLFTYHLDTDAFD